MQAAATTGPASGPLPASSTPTTILWPLDQRSHSRLRVGPDLDLWGHRNLQTGMQVNIPWKGSIQSNEHLFLCNRIPYSGTNPGRVNLCKLISGVAGARCSIGIVENVEDKQSQICMARNVGCYLCSASTQACCWICAPPRNATVCVALVLFCGKTPSSGTCTIWSWGKALVTIKCASLPRQPGACLLGVSCASRGWRFAATCSPTSRD